MVETVAVEEHLENTTARNEVNVRQRTSKGNVHDTHYEGKHGTYMAVDTVLSEEVYIKDRTDYNLQDTYGEGNNITSTETDIVPCLEPSSFANSSVSVETQEDIGENCKKVGMQELGSIDPESGNSKVQNQYQLGEFMSSCWQPVLRQDAYSDSESDLTESSSDASMTDIIPMLEELHPLIDMQPAHSSLASGDNLNTSSDDNEDDPEEDASTDENENNWKAAIDLNYLDMGNSSKLENMMDLQRAKNILKFELDRRLMGLQAADAVQKMEEASRFHVQVPSISTPRQNTFDSSNGSDEIIELPHVPSSAPSSLLPWKDIFDLPINQNMTHDSQLQETWTPHSYFSARQHRKQGNLYVQHSTSLHHNCFRLEKDEISEKDTHDSQLDSDAKQGGNNDKLFGSLEAHIGEEIKILSAAISDVDVLEVNSGIGDCNKNADFSDETSLSPPKSIQSTFEATDLVHAGIEQLILCSPCKVNNCEPHIVEADSMGEINSLFKCRMEEVLVQSISESSINQPLIVKLDDELSEPLSPDSGMHAIDNDEAMAFATSKPTCHNELIQEKSSETLLAGNGHYSELSNELLTSGNPQATDSPELQVSEARTIEVFHSFITKHCEESQKNVTLAPPVQSATKSTTDQLSLHSEQPGCFSEVHVLEENSAEDITAELEEVHDQVEIHDSSIPTIKHGDSSSCELHPFVSGSIEEEPCLVKQPDKEPHMKTISDASLHRPTTMELEEGESNEPLITDSELGVVQASSVE
ncbi:hypothetical protein GUJ93_ZPchr0011g28308 [Zizania palustris]|uniref:Uncharacterized protein n=1 Tax=Zizania palustris TaxID=103762 RepID=A0A8J6BKY9_ZIZPA|nr:hypothetical protein GUJ93_ZPchr0011g28308 [Zizania palustris]